MQNIKYISMKAVLIQTSQDTMHMQYMGNVPWMLLRSTRLPEQLFCHPSGLTAVWYILRTKFRQGRDLLSIFATIQSRFEPYWKNVVKNEILSQKEESPHCCWTTWGCKGGLRNNKHESMIVWRKAFHVKHGCEIMIYGDVIQKLIMNESIIDDNKLNLAFYKLTEWILVLSEVT